MEIMAAILCAVGGVIIFWKGRYLAQGWRSRNWPTTTGRVMTSRLDIGQRGDSGWCWQVIIDYEYSVHGELLTGRLTSDTLRKRPSQQLADQYSEGKNIPVYYHPSNARISVLVPGITWNNFGFFIIGVGYFTTGLLILWFR